VHGFITHPTSPLKLLFEFPFVLATTQAAIAVILLLWATMGRFGAPQAMPAPLKAGKQGLIENATKLVEFAGYQQAIVRRYFEATVRDVARQIHAPAGLSERRLLEWLGRVGRFRKVQVDCAEILQRADALLENRRGKPSALVPLVLDIHRWKGEILDGRSRHPRDHGRGARRGPEGGRRTA
jgi:hypothetical protein